MKVLFTGKGTSGSWEIRGRQVGEAVGAVVNPMATVEDCRAADVIVAVKRVPAQLLQNIRASGKRWVYDALDCYPQPECSVWNKDQSVCWLKNHLAQLLPDAVIWPNAKMRDDAEWGGLQQVIYHHHRPGIKINPIREKIEVVGYEGSPRFLAGIAPSLHGQCYGIGAKFVVNPVDISDLDVVVAFRCNGPSDYANPNWKSNVKIANAHASGTPFIGAIESAYSETSTGFERWANNPVALRDALESLKDQSVRREISEAFKKAALPLETVAQQYREFLQCVLKY